MVLAGSGLFLLLGLVLLVVSIIGGSGDKPAPRDQTVVSGDFPAAHEQKPVFSEPKQGITDPVQQKIPESIRQAIERGVDHIKKRVLEGANLYGKPVSGAGVQTGAVALAGLTLLEAGVPARDPAVEKALEQVRRHGPEVTHIYSLGAMLFFLNRLAAADALREDDRRLQRTLALQVVAGQCANGLWTYTNSPLSQAQEKDLLRQLEANTYTPTRQPVAIGTSNSMTQFGLLSLWGSRKHVPLRQPILHAAARFHSTQSAGGTWTYARPDMPHLFQDSNTCAGLLALAMEKILREDPEFRGVSGSTDPRAYPQADKQRDLALAHLAKVIGRTKNSPDVSTSTGKKWGAGNVFGADAFGDYYFLWCLERVAVIYSLETIGGKDWYKWGSDVILQNQRSDGSWLDNHGDIPDTCFAILFLTKANLAKDLTESLRRASNRPLVVNVPALPSVEVREPIPFNCHPGCFPAGTPIQTPQGLRPIDTIRVGDVVTTVRPDGASLPRKVQSVFRTQNGLVKVATEDGFLFTTRIQPLCLADGTIRPAGELKPGDKILRWQGGKCQAVSVRGVELTDRVEEVFNLVLGCCDMFIAGGFLARSKPPEDTVLSAQHGARLEAAAPSSKK